MLSVICTRKATSGENIRASITHTEECVRECDRINPSHSGIFDKVWIDEEEHRHIDALPSIQPLLLKTETLNLAEIRRDLCRRYTIRSDADNITIRLICRSVESEGRLSRENADFTLLRRELPG